MPKKNFSVVVIVILVCGLAFDIAHFDVVHAEDSIPPSVPEFTLKFVDKSYDVPPTTTSTIDLYTNKTTTTTIPGYHVKDQTIELSIKNQPCPTDIGGNKTFMTYLIQIKPHFSEDWENATRTSQVPADGAGFTIASFSANYKSSDQVDFRVQAILEYEHTVYVFTRLPVFGSDFGLYPFNVTDVYDTSDWSPTQTFTMPGTSTSSSSSTIITGLVVTLVLVSVGLLIYFKRRRREVARV